MVTGSTGSTQWAANLEVKCFDLLANPYLLLAALIASGSAGMSEGAGLPEPVDVDPATLDEVAMAERGISRLPMSLLESVAAFEVDEALTTAFGADLTESILALRRSEIGLFEGASDAELAAAIRWLH
jgi:glutamine synthetase